jgi:thiamine kinase-like enzyme
LVGNISEQWLPRLPAHSGLRTANPIWVKAVPELASTVCTWSGITGKVMRMDSMVNVPFGYYRIGSNPEIFVKIIPIDHSELQLRSDKMAAWLENQNISVSRLLVDFPKIINDEYAVLAYEYINGRFSNNSESDIKALGLSLGKLHNVMKVCPYQEEIKEAGIARHEMLMSRLVEIHNGRCSDHVPEDVRQLLTNASSELLQVLVDKAQVIHGDLNYGNVLFLGSKPMPVFLDFEDSWTAWFSPLMDLALVIERFTLIGSDEDALSLSSTLLNAYYTINDNRFEYTEELGMILKGMSVRSLLLLILVVDKYPERVTDSEWKKFVGLYAAANSRTELMCKIVAQ